MRSRPVKARGGTSAGYTVREVRDVSGETWDGWVRSSPGGGHVLQSHSWGEFKRERRWRPVRLVLERDGAVLGTGQFLSYNTLPVPGRLLYCTKGPWLPWDDAAAVRAFFEGLREVAGCEGAHTVKIEPEVPDERLDVKALLDDLGFRKARYDLNFSTTVVMDLSPSEEELLDRMSGKGKKGKTTRYNINLARRKGVEVYEPDVSRPEEFDRAFETLYAWIQGLAENKEGFSNRRPRQYFYDMMRRMSDARQGRFFFAAHEGRPLSGAYIFNFGEKFWFMHGASGPGDRKLQANYLLQWEIMRWAKRQGMTYCDFVGAPKREDRTPDNPYYGVYKFKTGFGGEAVDFPGCLDLRINLRRAAAWYEFEPLYYRAYYKLKHNVFY